MNDHRNRNSPHRGSNNPSKKKRFFDKKNNSQNSETNDFRNSQPQQNKQTNYRNHNPNQRRPFPHQNSNQNNNQNQGHHNSTRNQTSSDVKFRKNPNAEYGSINTKMVLPPEPNFAPSPLKNYGIVRFETFAQAKAKIEEIAEAAKKCDQLNIVIKAEGDMDDPDLKVYGKVFAGDAWYLIHERRLEENWYSKPH